eukprot:760281-Hanusia_phi.AAC.4
MEPLGGSVKTSFALTISSAAISLALPKSEGATRNSSSFECGSDFDEICSLQRSCSSAFSLESLALRPGRWIRTSKSPRSEFLERQAVQSSTRLWNEALVW